MPTKYLYVTQWHTFIEVRLKSVHVNGKVSQIQNTLNGVLSSGKTVWGHCCEKSQQIRILGFVAYCW